MLGTAIKDSLYRPHCQEQVTQCNVSDYAPVSTHKHTAGDTVILDEKSDPKYSVVSRQLAIQSVHVS